MKFIFDFDDVLFNNSKQFKEHMYACFEKRGVSKDKAKEYYENTIDNKRDRLWLKEMIAYFSAPEELYEEILNASKDFINEDLASLLKTLGNENCYIVTRGHQNFQMDKISRTELSDYFSEIIVVQGSKKEAVEEICEKHKDEKVIFIDDKAHHFGGLDFKKYPNLKTILYDEQGLNKLKAEING